MHVEDRMACQQRISARASRGGMTSVMPPTSTGSSGSAAALSTSAGRSIGVLKSIRRSV
jgi:hypothetical protein